MTAAQKQVGLVGRRGVGILEVVDEELRVPLVADVLLPLAMHLFVLAVAHPAKLHVPHRHVLDVVLLRNDGPAGFEHQRLEPLLDQLLGGPSAGDPRANDDGIVGVGRSGLHVRCLRLHAHRATSWMGAQPEWPGGMML